MVGLAPSTHDPGIIKGNHSNNIDAFCLELVEIVDVARYVLSGTAGCKGTYNAWRLD